MLYITALLAMVGYEPSASVTLALCFSRALVSEELTFSSRGLRAVVDLGAQGRDHHQQQKAISRQKAKG